MTCPTPTRRARAAGSALAACALLASVAARAQTAPPSEPPPPSAPAPATPPAATPPASAAPPPAAGPAAAPPPAAPAPPPAAPRPAGAQQPPAPYPYPYPYAYPPSGYPYPYPYAAPAYPYPPGAYPPPAAARAATPPPVESLAVAAAPPGSARTPAEDPQADRGVLLPTAYTHPKGTYYISDYDLVLAQIGYAFTDDTQLTMTGIPPLGEERIAFIDLTLKTSLYRGGRVRVAAMGSTSGLVAKEIGVMGVGRVGGVVQLCIEGQCDSSVSMSSNVTLAGVMLMANGVSGIFRLGRTLSLLAELDTLVPLVRDGGEFGGAMAGGGFRFHWTSWGLDATLMRILGNGKPTLPLFALTYRSGN